MAVDATELAKAEGGLTCCSLILRDEVLGLTESAGALAP